MIKKLKITIALLAVISSTQAQTISRKVISPGGGTLTGGGYILTYNIGETFIPSLSAGGSIITQGFEQPGEQIKTGIITPLSLCAGIGVSIPFEAIDIGGGNIFTAQLSNASGSFASPVNIGTLAGNASGSINAVIPTLTPVGSGYRIRVVSNSPGKEGSDNGMDIAISTGPPTNTPGSVIAPSTACSGQTGQLITVNALVGPNLQYSWNTGSNSSTVLFSTSAGGPYTTGPFATPTNQVYAQFGALAGGQSGYQICVQGTNACGNTNNKCVWIRGVVSGTGPITPPDGVVACPSTSQLYSCGTSAGATVYTWTLNGLTGPITPNGGNNPTNVSVAFPPAFTTGQLCVTAALSCGGPSTSAPRCITINKNPANPTVLSGTGTVCPGAPGVPYSIPAVPGATGYNWTVPANATIATGTNSPSITVDFPTPYNGSPSVCVTATSGCGASASKCKTVVSGIPNQPAGITGPLTNICGSTVQYSVVSPPGGLTYTWTNPSGTTISGSATGSTILLNVSPAFTNGFLTVVANSALCAPATSASRTSSTVWGRPNNPGAITANPTLWCTGGFVNFSTTPASPLPTYTWTVSNGTIGAGQGSSNIDVTWGATAAGTVTVKASNSCGISAGTSSQGFTAGCREEGINASSATAFSVYPNPAHDLLNVSFNSESNENYTIRIVDATGREVMYENKYSAEGENRIQLSLANIATGVYIINIQLGSTTMHTRIVKE